MRVWFFLVWGGRSLRDVREDGDIGDKSRDSMCLASALCSFLPICWRFLDTTVSTLMHHASRPQLLLESSRYSTDGNMKI